MSSSVVLATLQLEN